MGTPGITSFGAYIPRLRIERATVAAAHAWMAPSLKSQAKGRRAFASWDEDSITMAVEAIRNAVTSEDIRTFDRMTLASTALPYADVQGAAIVASAVGAPATMASVDVGGSYRAGTSALLQALKASEPSIVVASDAPRAKAASSQELSYGAGAAAFTIGLDDPIAVPVGSASVNEIFVDHFRPSTAPYEYHWEERWVRDEGYLRVVPKVIQAALNDGGLAIGEVDYLIVPSPLKGVAEAVAKRVGFSGIVVPQLDTEIGFTATAHPLLMLAGALETAGPGQIALVIGFGSGADALLLKVTEAIVTRRPRRAVSALVEDRLVTDSYLRMLSFADGVDLDWGMRSEKSNKTALTEQFRSAGQMEGFVAGRCPTCDTIQFPQLQYCVNCSSPGAEFTDVLLADEPAQVLTSTADWLTYHPAPPLHVGFVQFDNGARVLMEMVDIGSGGVDTGTQLRMVFRIKEKDRQRGYNRYFWKATPIDVASGA